MLNPNSVAAAILTDPAASYPLKETLARFLDRDPVDALNDAEALATALRDHLKMIQGTAPRRGGC